MVVTFKLVEIFTTLFSLTDYFVASASDSLVSLRVTSSERTIKLQMISA
jgi:hypothetical protein